MLNGRFVNESIISEAVNRALVLSHSTSGPIYTTTFLYVTTSNIYFYLGGCFVCLRLEESNDALFDPEDILTSQCIK